MKTLVHTLACVFVLLAGVRSAFAAPQERAPRVAPWSQEHLALAQRLPIQDGGRIKPLDTYASFTLLRMNGKRSVTTPAGEKLTPIAWLLDVLFFPEQAADYPSFVVQDGDVITAIGVSVEGKKKRDHYSFAELRPGLERLFELADQYRVIEEKHRNSLQQQTYALAINVRDFRQLAEAADFARVDLGVGASSSTAKLFDGAKQATFSQVLAKLPELRPVYFALKDDPARAQEFGEVSRLLEGVHELARNTEALAMFPPIGAVEAQPEWSAPTDLVRHAFEHGDIDPRHIAMLAAFEGLARAPHEPLAFTRSLAAFSTEVQMQAVPRGETAKIEMEVGYYKADLLYVALVLFVLAFVLASISWLVPQNRWMYRVTALAVTLPTLLLVAAIVWRCMIRGRPPVSTLYETTLFVTGVATLVALVAERLTRQRIALSVAATMGLIGLFVANGYESLEKRDTMPSLVAVLDTNFWLSTHVTSITIGYSAGMLGALLASLYLLRRCCFWLTPNPSFTRTLTRMVYGVLCFGLIFSTVGTILGGVWANESWGRFWGWDPKENGALLIVLAQIAILHGRMGGYLREFGLHAASAFLGTVVAFSWFGVNLLGVGLHSYGFTSGIHFWLWVYYLGQWALIAAAGAFWAKQHFGREAAHADQATHVDGARAVDAPTA